MDSVKGRKRARFRLVTVVTVVTLVLAGLGPAYALHGEAHHEPDYPSPQTNPDFEDPTKSPGPGYEWKGPGPVGSGQGAWHKPSTGESLHPDLAHPPPVGPHYDYTNPTGSYRWFPDGRIQPK